LRLEDRTIMTRIAFLLAATVVLGACSHKTTTVQTASGTITTSQDDKSVTVQTSEGTMNLGQTVDTSKLGAPVYPGATAKDRGSISTTTAAGTNTIATFKTTDPFDKVYAYYKQQLPAGSERMKMSTGDTQMASFQVGDQNGPDQVGVQISSDKAGTTNILISRVTKAQH
jgi:hypothetical protein